MKPVNIGLLGLGTVGGGTATVLQDNAAEISRRLGREVRISAVSIADIKICSFNSSMVV